MNTVNILTGIVIFCAAYAIFWWSQQKPAKKTQVQAEVVEPEKKSRFALATGVAGTKVVIGKIKPHVSGTFGLCAAVLVLGSAGLVYTYSGAIWYVLWLLPVLLVLTFLIIKASEIKSFPGRVLIIGALVVGAILFIGPHLPGSTPAQPIPYTTNQMAELREMRRACPGGKHEYNYLTTFQPVNPNGWCLTTFWHKGHCIYVRDERRTEHGPYCDLQGGAQIRLPMNIREVRSAQGAFVGFLERKPDYKMLSFYYSPE